MSDLISRARDFAKLAHGDQMRKYTGEPYVTHTQEVAAIVEAAGGTPDMVAAAHLHDVLEDTPTTEATLLSLFGAEVTRLVVDLTDQVPLSFGNRAARKRQESIRLGECDAAVQTVKLADIISNTRSIGEHDPKYARAVYLPEMRFLVSRLVLGPGDLQRQARELVGP